MVLDSKKRPQGTFDAELLLKADYATGAGNTTVYGLDGDGGSAIVLNVGEGLFKGMCIVDVSARVVGGDEIYGLTVQGGNVAAFNDATAPLATVTIGDDANIEGLSADDAVGRYKVYFDNERNGTFYPFIRLAIERTESTANITCKAYVVPVQ